MNPKTKPVFVPPTCIVVKVEPEDGSRPSEHETVTQCKSCDDNYALVPVDSAVPGGAQQCLSDGDADGLPDTADLCPNGERGWTSSTTINDKDGDGCRDMDEDVDDDNDGLIEIYDLNALHNINHNLAGTSYKTSAGATGLTSGAPTSLTNTECSSLSNGVALCGYELMNDLDFAEDESYADRTANLLKNLVYSYITTIFWYHFQNNLLRL